MKRFYFLTAFLLTFCFPFSTFAALPSTTGIVVGSQTGSLTYGTPGSVTYTVSFTRNGSNPTIAGMSVTGLPAGATYTPNPIPNMSAAGARDITPFELTITTLPNTPAGTHTVTIQSTSPSLSKTFQLKINQKDVDPTLDPVVSVKDKTYNGDTIAEVSCNVVGLVPGDIVDCNVGAGNFQDPNTGTGKPVSVANISLTGPQSSNYALSTTTLAGSGNILQADQVVTLSIATPTNPTFGDTDFDLMSIINTVTSNSGVSPTFSVSGSCEFTSGTTVHYTQGNSTPCIIKAFFASNLNFKSIEITAEYNISSKSQSINNSFVPPKSPALSDPDFSLLGYATSTAGLPVSYFASGSCVVLFDSTLHYVSSTTNICTISFMQIGDSSYLPASDVTLSYVVGPAIIPKSNQTISFSSIPNQLISSPDFSVSATSTSALTVVFSATTTSVCTVSGTTVHITGLGTCTILAEQEGNEMYNPAPQVSQTFTVSNLTVLTPVVTVIDKVYDRTTNASTTCTLTGVNGGDDVTCSVGTANFTTANASTTASTSVVYSGITLGGAQASNYSLATTTGVVQGSLLPAPQTIYFSIATPTNAKYGDPDFDLLSIISDATSTSGIPPILYASGACRFTSGTTLHYYSTGNLACFIKAYIRNDNLINGATTTNYNNTQVVTNWFVGKASQKISFVTAPPTKATVGDTPVTLAATSTSGLPITYRTNTNCSVSGNILSFVSGGDCVVVASQVGNSLYFPATEIRATTTIGKLSQTISYTPPPTNVTYGTPSVSLVASSSSGLPISYRSSGPCSVSGNILSFLAGGTCVTVVSQAGNVINAVAPLVRATTTIAKLNQAITFTFASTTVLLTSSPITLNATSTSGLPITYRTAFNCSVTGNLLTITAVGRCDVTAAQAGTTQYNPATDVRKILTIK